MNKTIRSMFILVVLFFVFAIFANAQQEEQAVWKVSEVTCGNQYSKAYSYKNCTINVQKDGKGVEIVISNPDYQGKSVVQTIIIGKSIDGKSVIEATSSLISDGGMHTESLDIFYAQYVIAAKKLPEEVKKAFCGYYGGIFM
jgi:hypothetical protein